VLVRESIESGGLCELLERLPDRHRFPNKLKRVDKTADVLVQISRWLVRSNESPLP
jgi:hypothetical protein